MKRQKDVNLAVTDPIFLCYTKLYMNKSIYIKVIGFIGIFLLALGAYSGSQQLKTSKSDSLEKIDQLTAQVDKLQQDRSDLQEALEKQKARIEKKIGEKLYIYKDGLLYQPTNEEESSWQHTNGGEFFTDHTVDFLVDEEKQHFFTLEYRGFHKLIMYYTYDTEKYGQIKTSILEYIPPDLHSNTTFVDIMPSGDSILVKRTQGEWCPSATIYQLFIAGTQRHLLNLTGCADQATTLDRQKIQTFAFYNASNNEIVYLEGSRRDANDFDFSIEAIHFFSILTKQDQPIEVQQNLVYAALNGVYSPLEKQQELGLKENEIIVVTNTDANSYQAFDLYTQELRRLDQSLFKP